MHVDFFVWKLASGRHDFLEFHHLAFLLNAWSLGIAALDFRQSPKNAALSSEIVPGPGNCCFVH
jgi:hypothetical protein